MLSTPRFPSMVQLSESIEASDPITFSYPISSDGYESESNGINASCSGLDKWLPAMVCHQTSFPLAEHQSNLASLFSPASRRELMLIIISPSPREPRETSGAVKTRCVLGRGSEPRHGLKETDRRQHVNNRFSTSTAVGESLICRVREVPWSPMLPVHLHQTKS